MASLSLRHLSKTYDNGVNAIRDFTLEVDDKEFMIFARPVGCGISTVLRMIAGVEDITDGELLDSLKISHDNLVKMGFGDWF